jgi:hypothetical protein
MEFFIGAFERDWERRRAALLHELQMGEHKELDWHWPRRGGAAYVAGDRGSFGGSARGQRRAVPLRGTGGGRPMRARFAALARGSQPAVVKLASYGSGVRAAAMMNYASRSGELPVENEKGERIVGLPALNDLRAEWEHLFDNRAASRDVGLFDVKIFVPSLSSVEDRYEFAQEILKGGLGERRFVLAVREKNAGELEVRGVVVLRDPSGERLTGDPQATAIVQERFVNSDVRREAEVRFQFSGYGNGVEFATARVRELVERVEKAGVRDETGRIIGDFEKAGDLVQKEWRRELHSRKGRDVMHLVVSARAGTDVTAFQTAVRDFLGEQFGEHRYVFALHDPADDPKEVGQGGRRPHIHAHAIVTMRSDTGERVVTSPQVFRQWRALMAEKARARGIDMEMTDRREFGNPPAYARNQVRPVSYAGRTEHKGTSSAAQVRYDDKRANRHSAPRSERSVGYALAALQVWEEIRQSDPNKAVFDFATGQIDRLQAGFRDSQIDIDKLKFSASASNLNANMIELEKLVGAGGPPVRAMTRPEFVTYENRIEEVLATVESSVKPAERAYFGEIAAAAREVINIRRAYLELTERESNAGTNQREAAEGLSWPVALQSRETRKEGQTVMKAARYGRSPEDLAGSPASGNSKSPKTDRDMTNGGIGARMNAPLAQGLPDGTSSPSAMGTDRSVSNLRVDRISGAVLNGHIGSPLEIAPDAGQEWPKRDREAAKATARRSQEGRSDPPQQQVPRLQELEREVDERQNGRHGRER